MTEKFKEAIRVYVPLAIFIILILVCAKLSQAQEPITVKDDCQNPETLSPEMKKAFEELKNLLKDEPGIKVEIDCK